jgi:uncharacterized OB-fold protein
LSEQIAAQAPPAPAAQHSTGAILATDVAPLKDLTGQGSDFELQDGQVLLRGSRSLSSGSLAFPAREVCLETGARDMVPMSFGPGGKLYSFSTVHVSSSRPVPYTIGYVDFENGVRVLCQIETSDQMLQCDMPVQLRAEGERWFVVPTRGEEIRA